MLGETIEDSEGEIQVSFGYHFEKPRHIDIPSGGKLRRASRSFSCLSGAALSANATLANTNICNGLISSEMLPILDSPTSFRRVPSSPSLTKMDFLSSSLPSNMSSILSIAPPSPDYNGLELQVAGGAAGEDRVQAVCSEENGWLFCAVYDGFNGRDAADYLAGALYEKVDFHLNLLDWDLSDDSDDVGKKKCRDGEGYFGNDVLDSLQRALFQAEDEFLNMVEREMEERPDLVSIGSCVLVALLHGKRLYLLNVGDSRAVLATYDGENEGLRSIQLTESHTVDNNVERIRLLNDHPDDPHTIWGGRVKGKLKVTRAFGVGYLKKESMNDALMGILRVRNLISPPYVSLNPSLSVHEVSNDDHFVVLGSDGLFDFFSNDEVINIAHSYISRSPLGDPAKYLVEQLVARAADSAGKSLDELMSIPAGRRRQYHDDVTVIVIILGSNSRTSKASTCL